MDAKILGLHGRMVHDEGAYFPWGLTVPWIAATTVPGPYVIPSFKMEVIVAFTNKISTTPAGATSSRRSHKLGSTRALSRGRRGSL